MTTENNPQSVEEPVDDVAVFRAETPAVAAPEEAVFLAYTDGTDPDALVAEAADVLPNAAERDAAGPTPTDGDVPSVITVDAELTVSDPDAPVAESVAEPIAEPLPPVADEWQTHD